MKNFGPLADTILNLTHNKTREEVNGIMAEVAGLLHAQGDLRKWRLLAKALRRAGLEKGGDTDTTLTSASAVTKAIRDKMGVHEETIDERLIGGAVIEQNHVRVDASLKGALESLRAELQKTL